MNSPILVFFSGPAISSMLCMCFCTRRKFPSNFSGWCYELAAMQTQISSKSNNVTAFRKIDVPTACESFEISPHSHQYLCSVLTLLPVQPRRPSRVFSTDVPDSEHIWTEILVDFFVIAHRCIMSVACLFSFLVLVSLCFALLLFLLSHECILPCGWVSFTAHVRRCFPQAPALWTATR